MTETPSTETNSPTRATKKQLFLEAIAKVGNISEAARLVDINRASHYDWLSDADGGKAYQQAFEDAMEQFADLVRETVKNRAIFGTQHEIWFKGVMVGYRYEYSDRLLELQAKAKCPEFREKHELTGPNGSALKIEVVTGVPQPE
jgi:hypothetical protein